MLLLFQQKKRGRESESFIIISSSFLRMEIMGPLFCFHTFRVHVCVSVCLNVSGGKTQTNEILLIQIDKKNSYLLDKHNTEWQNEKSNNKMKWNEMQKKRRMSILSNRKKTEANQTIVYAHFFCSMILTTFALESETWITSPIYEERQRKKMR